MILKDIFMAMFSLKLVYEAAISMFSINNSGPCWHRKCPPVFLHFERGGLSARCSASTGGGEDSKLNPHGVVFLTRQETD